MRSVEYLVAAEPVDRSVYLSRIPDAILPSQFFESVGARTFSSEQRLMLAVLADAISWGVPTRQISAGVTLSMRRGLGSSLTHNKLAVIRSRMRCTRVGRRQSAKAPVGVGL